MLKKKHSNLCIEINFARPNMCCVVGGGGGKGEEEGKRTHRHLKFPSREVGNCLAELLIYHI